MHEKGVLLPLLSNIPGSPGAVHESVKWSGIRPDLKVARVEFLGHALDILPPQVLLSPLGTLFTTSMNLVRSSS